jgi:hypothetical protein
MTRTDISLKNLHQKECFTQSSKKLEFFFVFEVAAKVRKQKLISGFFFISNCLKWPLKENNYLKVQKQGSFFSLRQHVITGKVCSFNRKFQYGWKTLFYVSAKYF